MELEMRPVVVKTFPAATEAIAAEHFASDSTVAARLGYVSTSQSWDGRQLTVVYQLQPSDEAEPPDPQPTTRAEANAQANQARAEANAQANQARAEANAQANQARAKGPDPGGQPPPATGSPPPATPPSAVRPRDRGGLVAGVVIIGIGLFFLLAQVIPDIGRWIPLFIGLAFLAAFVPQREYGLLIPGCIITGVGVGVVLTGVVDDPWSGAAVLFSLAGGFIAIWVVSLLLRRVDRDWPRGSSRDAAQALWWPLIPGGILALVGVIVLAESGFESDLLRWWPLLIIGAGIVVLVSALSRRSDGQAP